MSPRDKAHLTRRGFFMTGADRQLGDLWNEDSSRRTFLLDDRDEVLGSLVLH